MKRSKHLTAVLLVMILVVTSLLAGCKKNDAADTSGEATTTPTAEATTPEPTTEATPEPTEAAASQDAAAVAASLPREETLYFAGQQWGAINDYNPFSSNSNNWWIEQNDDARVMVYETLFMYNQNDGKLYGLLADSYEQKDKEFTVKLKAAAKWSDGTQVTADDVVYTFDAHKRLETNQGTQFSAYIESVKAVDSQTVVFTASSENYNPLKVLEVFPKVFIVNKAQMSKLEADNGNDPDKIKIAKNENLVASGPYKPYYDDETKVVVIRDDNYWGQDDSMWKKLPAPKYLAHNIFIDNNAGAIALEQGEVDVSQQFMSEVWKMWEGKDGKPVSTYLDDLPYYDCVSLPTAIFNVTKPGLDQVALRKALVIATDYDQIATTAMSGYTPLMSDVPPSLMNPTAPERALIDEAQLKDLQWKGKQIDEAKALLDEAGIKDTDGDGYREYDGKKIEFTVQCPSGWTDWNSALEMVAAAGQAIGLDVTTLWTTAAEWTTNRLTGNFDVIMWTYAGASISNPWTRCYQSMYTTSAKDGENADWNFGRYSNPDADKIIDEIPTVTDEAKLKELYTELNKIYLTDVPCFALMYRPGLFHTVNESIWTGFPQADDGTNVPPTVLTDGYGIAGLYNLTLVAK